MTFPNPSRLCFSFVLASWIINEFEKTSSQESWKILTLQQGVFASQHILLLTLYPIGHYDIRRDKFRVGVGTLYNRTHNNWVTWSTAPTVAFYADLWNTDPSRQQLLLQTRPCCRSEHMRSSPWSTVHHFGVHQYGFQRRYLSGRYLRPVGPLSCHQSTVKIFLSQANSEPTSEYYNSISFTIYHVLSL